MEKYEITFITGRRILVDGPIYLFSDSSNQVINKNANSFNSAAIQSVIKVNSKETTKDLIEELKQRNDVHVIDEEGVYQVRLDLAKAKDYTVIVNNWSGSER